MTRKARYEMVRKERLLLQKAADRRKAADGKARAAERAAATAAYAAEARSAKESNRQRDEHGRVIKPAAAAWTATKALKEKGKPVVVVADETHRGQLERLGKMNRR